MFILNAIGIILQYGLLLLLYYFLYKVARLVYADIAGVKLAPPLAVAPLAAPQSALRPEATLAVTAAGPVNMSQSSYRLGESTTIGRSTEADIVINDSFVSHEHACITRFKQDYWLADLHSTNGTLLNKRPLKEETCLKDGDTITIGAVTFRFER
jgi:hypothetical protein